MNIKQAKTELMHTVSAYLAKNEAGEYRIPAIRQRPILLMGPPGIGKTQIMEQIARECRIGLVAYTITHHTRQSAVGLPFIRERNYGGKTYSVTEYTMSEIIASVHQKMEESGLKEGILFLDEINCVSETLAPAMLQFLQCKTFGNQAVPEGWIIVAAGNPPEYNKSVRDFDMVTLDRVRYLDVEADVKVWKEYAKERRIHGAILSYLELRPKNFYRVEADVDGLQFVTARGWEDLSSLMGTYEELGIPVDESVVHEFLRHKDVAEDAAAYFDLYRKYRDDYGIGEILAGKVKPQVYQRIFQAAFDERLSVVNLLSDGLKGMFEQVRKQKTKVDRWYQFLKIYRAALDTCGDPLECYEQQLQEEENRFLQDKQGGFYTREEAFEKETLLKALREHMPRTESVEGDGASGGEGNFAKADVFALAKAGFDRERNQLEELEQKTKEAVEHAFDFMEQAFEQREEMVVFVTELTLGTASALFFAEHGCERYFRYNEALLAGTRKAELLSELRR